MTNLEQWVKAVSEYAKDLVERLEENEHTVTIKNILCGAKDWREYSMGGCSLCYDYQIKERFGIDKDIEVDSIKLMELQAMALQQAAQLLLDAKHAKRFIERHTVKA